MHKDVGVICSRADRPRLLALFFCCRVATTSRSPPTYPPAITLKPKRAVPISNRSSLSLPTFCIKRPFILIAGHRRKRPGPLLSFLKSDLVGSWPCPRSKPGQVLESLVFLVAVPCNPSGKCDKDADTFLSVLNLSLLTSLW